MTAGPPSTPTSVSARSVAFDAAVAVGCAVISASIAASLVRDQPGWWRASAGGLLAVHTLVLAFRRRSPMRVFGVLAAAGLALLLLGLPTVGLGLAPLVGVYSVALCRPRRQSTGALTLAVLVLLLGQVAAGFPQQVSTVVVDGLVLSAAWAAGRFVRSRDAALAALDEKNRELLEARQDLARAAVTEERLRMARDLHDIVAHSLSLIAVQAGVGAHVAGSDPEASRRALVTIGEVSRQALADLRHAVKVLRSGPAGGLAPVAGLAELAGLAEQVGGSGVHVDVVRDGEPQPIPPAVDITAYRIVQESLTNVVRHAHATMARVRVTCTAGEVRVEVVDDGRTGSGRPTGSPAGGNGLTGMRERAHLLGGTLEAGPLPEGGFRVAARLPMLGSVR